MPAPTGKDAGPKVCLWHIERPRTPPGGDRRPGGSDGLLRDGPLPLTVEMPTPTEKIAANLRAFQIALNSHDRENPTHTAHGIGLAHFDMERLGFEEGEEVLPGITIHADGGVTGNFRVLCDGDHLEELEAQEAEVVDAVSTQSMPVPVGTPDEDRRSA